VFAIEWSAATCVYMICEGSVEALTMAEQLELASNDDLTLLSSEILTSPVTRNADEGCFNAAFAADSAE